PPLTALNPFVDHFTSNKFSTVKTCGIYFSDAVSKYGIATDSSPLCFTCPLRGRGRLIFSPSQDGCLFACYSTDFREGFFARLTIVCKKFTMEMTPSSRKPP